MRVQEQNVKAVQQHIKHVKAGTTIKQKTKNVNAGTAINKSQQKTLRRVQQQITTIKTNKR